MATNEGQREDPTVTETTGLETPDEAIKRMKEYTVVDSDVHEININIEKYVKYMEEPWKSRMEHIARTDEPLAGSIAGTFPHDLDPTPHGLGEDVKTTTPEGLRAFMDRFHTDYILLHGHLFEAVCNVPDRGFAAAMCSAYNDYVLDAYLDEHDGFKSSIRIAGQAPTRSAEEIHRLADEDDMVSIHMPAPINGLLGNPEYDPIFEAAAEEDLPIDYHPSMSNPPWSNRHGHAMSPNNTAGYTIVGNQALMAHIPSLVFGGVPESYPDLNHIFLEGGITWLPWLMGRMDANYKRRNHEFPRLSKKPSEYIQDNFFFGTQPLEEVAGAGNLRKIIEMIDGKNNLLYTSDFPHFDFDFPSILTVPKLPEETERRIFGQNAMGIMDI